MNTQGSVSSCTCIACLGLDEGERNLAKAQSEEQATRHEIDRATMLLQQPGDDNRREVLRAYLAMLRAQKDDCWVAIRRAKVALATAQLEVMRRHQPERYSKLGVYDRAKKSVDAVFRAPRGIFVGALNEEET